MAAPREIVVFAYDGVQSLDVAGPVEVLDTAGRIAARDPDRNASYRVRLAGPTAAPVTTSSGLRLHVDAALDSLADEIDTLVVAGGSSARTLAADGTVSAAIARAAARARRVASVCTGAFLLAAAGLLDGRRVTTHFASCAALARAHPALTVVPDAIYVRDGAVLTSAGVTAGMDLALALVEEDLGRRVALHTARYLVMFVRRAGSQPQLSAQLSNDLAVRDPIREVQAWIAEHADADLRIEQLARRAGMSPRNFARVFRREVGTTPAAYVEAVRIEIARRLLESSRLDMTAVACASGFGTDHSLRAAFARRLGTSPTAYRARFAPETTWTS